MFYNPAFDEANYYQGNKFQLGGADRSFTLDNSLPGIRRRISTPRSDERIQEDAWRTLIRNYKIDLSGIDILVKSGTLQLQGVVASLSDKQEAERTLELVPGVVEIVNDIKVSRINE